MTIKINDKRITNDYSAAYYYKLAADIVENQLSEHVEFGGFIMTKDYFKTTSYARGRVDVCICLNFASHDALIIYA